MTLFRDVNIVLTKEEMLFAAGIFQSVFSQQAPIPAYFAKAPPASAELVLSNIPINRANLAVLDAFPENRRKGMALAFRLMELTTFLDDPRVAKWTRKTGTSEQVSDKVFAALATYKVTKSDARNLENFCAELIKLGEPDDLPANDEALT
jgi:hypothetical protein